MQKKSPKSSKQQDFHLNNNKLDIVQEYTYLGVKLSSTGNFTTNQTQSIEKALHTFYNLTRIIDLKRLKPKHANKLFKTLIVPILSYGCEVWGAYLKQTFQNWEKSPIEKVHFRFCKYYLGVNGKATNIACKAELGRFSLKLLMDLRILKYFIRLTDLPEDSLAKQAFMMCKILFDAYKSSFHTNLHHILELYNIDRPNNQELLVTDTSCNSYLKVMKAEYLKIWESKLISSRKLNLYQTFKTNYNEEPYLMAIHNVEQRIQYTKFRISNHNLAIEEGRYGKVPIENRLCTFCNNSEIETERHMLFKCAHYAEIRSEFLVRLTAVKDIKTENENEFLHFLMTIHDHKLIRLVSKFILRCFQLRNAEDVT